MSGDAALLAGAVTAFFLAAVLGRNARELTDTYEQRQGLQLFAVLLAVAGIWLLAAAY